MTSVASLYQTQTVAHSYTHAHLHTGTDTHTPVFLEKSCKIDKDDGY